jgi:hypothetical protein
MRLNNKPRFQALPARLSSIVKFVTALAFSISSRSCRLQTIRCSTGRPTEINTGTFDDWPSLQQTFWGAYGTVPFDLINKSGQADLYYMGIDNTRATYQQGSAREIRHTIGTRLFNRSVATLLEPGFDYNWELIYQTGTFA